jgi:hypothetical protein
VPNPHEAFLDLCLLDADFNRPIYLDAFLKWFLPSASPAELKALRRAIRDRARALRQTHKKGRPHAVESWQWIRSSLKLVWHREIDGWSWPRIAAAAGLKPTKANLSTLHNRRDYYATLIWQALPAPRGGLKALKKLLDARSIQRLLRSKLAIPFNTHPQQCKRLVLKLAPRGLELSSQQWSK